MVRALRLGRQAAGMALLLTWDHRSARPEFPGSCSAGSRPTRRSARAGSRRRGARWRASLGKIETTLVRRLISRLRRSMRVGRVDLAPVALREGHVGEHLVLGARPSARRACGTCSRRRSATARHSARAASSVSCTKAVRMAAATMARCLTPAWAMALRMKCTRQRCQAAWNTFFAAALMPSCASEMTSLTPRKPARCQGAQELGPERLGLRRPDGHAQHLAAAVRVDAHSHYRGHGDDPAALALLHVGGIDPQVGPMSLRSGG